jgi:hypothetical protein
MLRPFIYSVGAAANELTIVGWVGENPGAGLATVRVGATAAPIRSWGGATTLHCNPVQNGGDVVVTVNGVKSLPVPLTKFQGTYDYTYRERGSLTQRATIPFEFLADVRTYRVRIDEAPQWRLPRPIFAINTTGGTFEASGEYRNQQGDLVEVWTGSGTLTLSKPGSTGNEVNLGGMIDKTGLASTSIYVGMSGTYQKDNSAAIMSIKYDVATLSSPMSDAFSISGATYTGASGSASWEGTFSNITATFTPESETVR